MTYHYCIFSKEDTDVKTSRPNVILLAAAVLALFAALMTGCSDLTKPSQIPDPAAAGTEQHSGEPVRDTSAPPEPDAPLTGESENSDATVTGDDATEPAPGTASGESEDVTSVPEETSSPAETSLPETVASAPGTGSAEATDPEVPLTAESPETGTVTEQETLPGTEPAATDHVHSFKLAPKQEDRWLYDNSCGKPRHIIYWCTGCNENKYEDDGLYGHDYTADGYCRYCLEVRDDVLAAQGLTFTDNPDGETVTLTGMSDNCPNTHIVIPAVHGGKRVSAVGAGAFRGNAKITRVTFLGTPENQSFKIDSRHYPFMNGIETIGEQAFAGCLSLESVSLPSSLKTIGNGAFDGDVSLDFDLRFAKGLTSIGVRAFAGCAMRNLNLNGTAIKTIGDEAFFGAGTETLTADATELSSIGKSAFERCASLSKIKFPEYSLKSIGERAFAFCTSIPANISIPHKTEIGTDAFIGTPRQTGTFTDPESGLEYELSNLKIKITGRGKNTARDLVIPALIDGMPVVSVTGFAGDEALVTLVFEEGIAAVGGGSFANCPNLAKVVLPASLKTFGPGCFKGCAKLEQIAFTDPAVNVGTSYEVFSGCPGYMSDYDNGLIFRLNPDCASYTVYSIQVSKTEIVIPETYNGLPVTALSSNLRVWRGDFIRQPNAVSVYVPDTVTSIAPSAFAKFGKLTEIRLPANLREIPSRCFFGCASLKEVVIPDQVTSIGSSAFAESGIESVIIPDSVTEIGVGAFSVCFRLKRAVLGQGLTAIPNAAFSDTELESVTIPAGVKSIGDMAFSGCCNLDEVIFCNPSVIISENAFFRSPSFFPGLITDPGTGIRYAPNGTGCTVFGASRSAAFTGIPAQLGGMPVTAIAPFAFFRNPAVTGEIVIPDTVGTIGEHAFNQTGITSLRLGSGTKTVEALAFAQCQNLVSVDFANVETIGGQAFDCSFESQVSEIYLPDSLKYLGRNVFWHVGRISISAGTQLADGLYQLTAITDEIEIRPVP